MREKTREEVEEGKKNWEKKRQRLTNQNTAIEQSDSLLIGAKRSASFFFFSSSSFLSLLEYQRIACQIKKTQWRSPEQLPMCITTTILIHRKIDYGQIDEIPSTKSEIREYRLCTHSNMRTTNTSVLFFLQCRQRINFSLSLDFFCCWSKHLIV